MMFIKRRKQRGFTLVELMTSLSVAGISLAIAIPSFTNMVNNNRRITAVNRIVTTMHSARSEAITRNQQVTVCASKNGTACDGDGWNAGWLFFVDLDRDRAVDIGEPILGTGPAIPKLDVDSSVFPSFFAYRPSGRIMGADVDANEGQFTVCDSRGADYARVLIVSQSGQPRLSYNQIDGSAPVCAG
jgi:type IV fimbrial biogenesis protein FimT